MKQIDNMVIIIAVIIAFFPLTQLSPAALSVQPERPEVAEEAVESPAQVEAGESVGQSRGLIFHLEADHYLAGQQPARRKDETQYATIPDDVYDNLIFEVNPWFERHKSPDSNEFQGRLNLDPDPGVASDILWEQTYEP